MNAKKIMALTFADRLMRRKLEDLSKNFKKLSKEFNNIKMSIKSARR